MAQFFCVAQSLVPWVLTALRLVGSKVSLMSATTESTLKLSLSCSRNLHWQARRVSAHRLSPWTRSPTISLKADLRDLVFKIDGEKRAAGTALCRHTHAPIMVAHHWTDLNWSASFIPTIGEVERRSNIPVALLDDMSIYLCPL